MPTFAEIYGYSWIVLAAAGWLVLAVVGRTITDNPRGDIEGGLVILVARVYARLVHRLRINGQENVPRSRHPGPLVLVANHTSGVDPILLQVAVPFEIRFMMARDMQAGGLDWIWKWTGVIAVDRDARGGDTAAAREAIRFLQSAGRREESGRRRSGVIGIFPEGGIERPARQVLPFLPGVGLLVHKARARVLPVVIDGTPRSATAWGSLFRTSRASVTFLSPVDYQASGLKAAEIAADLRRRFLAHTGWPANDTPSLSAVRA